MSTCTTATCPHGKPSFIWLGDGPWTGDPADPDSGRYPWVHAAPVGPGRLQVCDLQPFATPAEAGEVCAGCGHATGRHKQPGPAAWGTARDPWPCTDCPCPGMRYGQQAATPPHPDGSAARLMRGESQPGGQGACSRAGCGHLSLYHRDPESHSRQSYRGQRCYRPGCRCNGWTDDPEAVMPAVPLVQGSLFDEWAGDAA